MKTGTANLPLHHGAAPRWLFTRMVRLSQEIVRIMVQEQGTVAFLGRLADPHWFQAFGCVLGFDWHSSGLTTTTCGALKVALENVGHELGLWAAGGKGNTSRRTPDEIRDHGHRLDVDPESLVCASKLSAKVDNTAVQDGYQLYHHVMVFDRAGHWAVVQQGMNEANRYARRYHWLGDAVEDYVDEPHAAVCCDDRHPSLNMVAHESNASRSATADTACLHPDKLVQELAHLKTLDLPRRHVLQLRDINPSRLTRIFAKTYERQPKDFETLLGMRGVGPATIRALSLTAELMFGTKPSFRDPARFGFAHGGKDGIPYPVDRTTYERTIHVLRTAIEHARVGSRDRLDAVARLSRWQAETHKEAVHHA